MGWPANSKPVSVDWWTTKHDRTNLEFTYFIGSNSRVQKKGVAKMQQRRLKETNVVFRRQIPEERFLTSRMLVSGWVVGARARFFVPASSEIAMPTPAAFHGGASAGSCRLARRLSGLATGQAGRAVGRPGLAPSWPAYGVGPDGRPEYNCSDRLLLNFDSETAPGVQI